MPFSFPQCYSMWGPETRHPQLRGKQGRDHPHFGKKTVAFGRKELPREDRTPSNGWRFEQTLHPLSAGADVALRGRALGTPDPRGPQSRSGAPVGQQAQATHWAHGLPFRVRWLTSGNTHTGNGHCGALEERCRKINLEMALGWTPETGQGVAMKAAPM